jgi:hypothetical protein
MAPKRSPTAATTGFKLLMAFESLFRGRIYNHRNSSLGNFVATHLYEDLYAGSHSEKFRQRVDSRSCVVNVAGSTRGVKARRGDGTFGTIVPGTKPVQLPGFMVWHGMVALTQVGTEVKILAKSQLKQIDRVITDLVSSGKSLKAKSHRAITVAVAAVNFSEKYTGVEGSREFPIDRTPSRAEREAHETARRLEEQVAPVFDEFLLFRFRATNRPPYPFGWLNVAAVNADYGAALVRIGQLYEHRF